MDSCTVSFFSCCSIALLTAIFSVAIQFFIFFFRSHWEYFLSKAKGEPVGASDTLSTISLTLLLWFFRACEQEGPCVHEALQVLLEQRLAPGSGGLPMRPPRKRSRFARRAN
ncbi:hypothetical protein TYRP_020169 [Tyrophagus putrescentiae]|nr:hypothetical protein TYRP_020169 [Tyrophagus putrescentiae]